MDISGRIRINLPTDMVIAACFKPQNLELLLPVSGRITRIDDTHYRLVLQPKTPFIKAKVTGELAITPTETGRNFDLQGSAKVALVGGVGLVGRLDFADAGAAACTLSYTSTLTGSGLIGRALTHREAEMRTRLQEGLKALRRRIVRGQQSLIAAGEAGDDNE